MVCLQSYREYLSLATFRRVHSNSKEVSHQPWQNKYSDLKTTCHIKPKNFSKTPGEVIPGEIPNICCCGFKGGLGKIYNCIVLLTLLNTFFTCSLKFSFKSKSISKCSWISECVTLVPLNVKDGWLDLWSLWVKTTSGDMYGWCVLILLCI